MPRIDELKTHLARSRLILEETIERLTPQQWETQVQSEGERWTARQIVAHLLDAERGMTGQMQRILAGQPTIPDDFDLDRWNRGAVRKLADLAPDDLLIGLAESRAALLEFVDNLTDADLSRQGRHPSLGLISIERYLQQIADHEAGHAADIRAALA